MASLLTTPLAPEDIFNLVNPLASARQLRGVVTKVVRETPDSTTIHFRPGRGWNPHAAGQWARIGVEIDANMVSTPRTNPYVRMDGWDEEVAKINAKKAA